MRAGIPVVMLMAFFGSAVLADDCRFEHCAFEEAAAISFMSAPYTYSPTSFAIKRAQAAGGVLESKTEPSVAVTGYLSRPVGEGPFPAIVLLHSCAGLSAYEALWADLLVG